MALINIIEKEIFSLIVKIIYLNWTRDKEIVC